MILGGVSALVIVAFVSILVAINRKICCKHNHRAGYNDKGKKSSAKKIKKRKIGYDIPIESRPTVSSVIWQQEENDIAEEVKKIYRNISNCSKPVLFDTDCGERLQANYNTNTMDMQSGKAQFEDDQTRYKGKMKELVNRMDLHVDVNNAKHKNLRNSSYQRQAGAFLSKNHVAGAKVQEVVMEEMRRSQVQEWVDNSVGTLDREEEINVRETVDEILPHGTNRACLELDLQEKTEGKNIHQQKLEKKNRGFADQTPDEQGNVPVDIRASRGGEMTECDEKANDVKNLKSCLKKGTKWKESPIEKNVQEMNECNRIHEGNFDKRELDQRKLTFTDSENFATARDVKKFIVTRWIDHSISQHKSRVTEEESDTTLAEKSANELEYEDIDSVLTSVSRMDEGRLSKLKASEFYKELLKRKINRYRTLGEKIDEVSLVDKEDARGDEEELESEPTIKNDRMVIEEKRNYLVTDKGEATTMYRTKRESLSESNVIDQISDYRTNAGKFEEGLKTNCEEDNSFGSEVSEKENDVSLKYSIVRNFSDRLKPTIYVSLQHIHGLGKVFGYQNRAIARLYFANDSEEYEESDSMRCFDDIYQEQMFSVVGTSIKAIIKDFLVIEIILEDNDEPELYVKLPLEGLKHKATLIDAVIFQHGQFVEAS